MKKRPRVLFPVTDLDRHGAQRQLLELVKGLDKSQFRPVVLSMSPGGAMTAEFKRVPGVRVICLERKGKYDFLYIFRVERVLRRLKIDVVQPFLTPATLFGLLPALLCRTPVKIVTERLAQRREVLGQSLYRNVEDLLSRFADQAVANSEAGRKYLIQRHINPKKTKVIYNGLNLNRLNSNRDSVEKIRQELGVPAAGNVVGIVARLFTQKHHATFLRAAAIVIHSAPDTRFALIGDGPLRDNLENLNRELGLTEKAVFFGEQEDVGTYYASFDIAVLTSEAEGCSNSLLEAMAQGKPVVATDVGGNRELIEHGKTGLLVPFGDSEAIAEAVLSLINNPDLAAAMGQKAKADVYSRFSVAHMVEQYESLYEESLYCRSG